MAAAFADYSSEQRMGGKREIVNAVITKAFDRVLNEFYEFSDFELTCWRDGLVFEGNVPQTASDDDWNRALSEGLAVKFSIDWSYRRYAPHDSRVLRQGETIFDIMKSEGLSPDWNGTPEGDFTITVVDTDATKLALAMALHPRLGSNSRISLVSSLRPASMHFRCLSDVLSLLLWPACGSPNFGCGRLKLLWCAASLIWR